MISSGVLSSVVDFVVIWVVDSVVVICWVDEDCVVVVRFVLGKTVVVVRVVDSRVVVIGWIVVVSVLDSGVVAVVIARIVVIFMGGLSRDD